MPQLKTIVKAPITQGFIAAAGYGTRLRPLTLTVPKPLVPVAGKAMLDYALENLADVGVDQVAINTHYLADKIEDYIVNFNFKGHMALSYEPELLDTGGGTKKALPLLEPAPFYMLSGDSLLCDGSGGPALARLADAWDGDKMDILLLMQPCTRMVLTDSVGDYDLDTQGRAIRALDQGGAYMWTSARICHPRIFEDTPDGAFSFLALMDRAQEQGRLYGMVHDGDWHHISTPEDLARVDTMLAESAEGQL